MDKLKVYGNAQLNGEVSISGSKNSALPIIFSTLLCEGEHRLDSLPDLVDVNYALKIIKELGGDYSFDKENNKATIQIGAELKKEAEYDLVRKMRASILILGPMLSRFGYAKVSLPGGCAIGTRPIDLHLKAMEKMGATIKIENGFVVAEAKKLKGANIFFSFPTVGGTENALMAAVLAEGETKIENAAREPEIVDLGEALIKMGAKIEGLGSSTITIQGVSKLQPIQHRVISDRIEAGTFILAALATFSDVVVSNVEPDHLKAFFDVLDEMGTQLEIQGKTVKVWGSRSKNLKAVQVKTSPYPGFPTDLQAQLMALMTQAHGLSSIEEDIFENRFMHVQELVRLGAQIKIQAKVAQIKGPSVLSGAPVMATDLRASASLIIAALCAEGETLINRIYHLDRGYENIEKKLFALNAKVERVN